MSLLISQMAVMHKFGSNLINNKDNWLCKIKSKSIMNINF